jgi:nucleolar pre-ribosomal-associated protein 1
MQLQSVRGNEVIAWVKVVGNILTVVDPGKLETSTGGEWRIVLCRILLLLVSPNELGMTVFALTVSVTLRLSLLPGPPIPHLSLLVEQLLGSLKRFEKEMRLPLSYHNGHAAQSQTLRLHGALGLLEAPSSHDPVQIWGEGVEALWRITTTFERKLSAWDALTCRLLLWRSVVGEDGSVVGEWARKEVIRNLRTQ